MEIIDNSPIFEPAEGSLVVERSAAAQVFECNRFYITPDCDKVVRNVLTVNGMNSHKQVNQYLLDTECEMPDIKNLPVLSSAIAEEKANIILALYTPCRNERYFIINHIEHGNEYSALPLMAYSAERITKHCLHEALKIFAILNPEQFLENVHDQFSTSSFVKNYLKDLQEKVTGGPTFGMAPPIPNIKEALGIDGIITHKQRRKALDDMDKYLVENIRRFKKKATTEKEKTERRKAEAEIELVCSSIDGETVKRLFAIMSQQQRERALKLIDPREIAKSSEMVLSIDKVSVEYIGSRSTDGYYRLFLKKGDTSLPVHFTRRSSVVLYTIYMTDKLIKAEVDTLNLRQYKEAFINLYEKFYKSKQEGEEKYKMLWQKYDKQPQLSLCINDIRQTISSACKQMDEIASPYILETEYSHLFVESTKLCIPTELVELVKQR